MNLLCCIFSTLLTRIIPRDLSYIFSSIERTRSFRGRLFPFKVIFWHFFIRLFLSLPIRLSCSNPRFFLRAASSFLPKCSLQLQLQLRVFLFSLAHQLSSRRAEAFHLTHRPFCFSISFFLLFRSLFSV